MSHEKGFEGGSLRREGPLYLDSVMSNNPMSPSMKSPTPGKESTVEARSRAVLLM